MNRKTFIIPLIITVLSALTTKAVVHFFFSTPSFLRTIVTFFYLSFSFITIFYVVFEPNLTNWFFLNRKIDFRILKLKLFNQTFGAWLVLIIILIPISALLISKIPIVSQASNPTWVSILSNNGEDNPPELSIANNLNQSPINFIWQPYSLTRLGIRIVAGISPIQLTQVKADNRIVDPKDININGEAKLSDDDKTILIEQQALLSWEGETRTIDLSYLPSKITAEILWNDQSIIHDFSTGNEPVHLSLGGTYSGWALLPYKAPEGIILTVMPRNQPIQIKNITIWSKDKITFENDTLAKIIPLSKSCTIEFKNSEIIISSSNSSSISGCKIQLPGVARVSDKIQVLLLKVVLFVLCMLLLLYFFWVIRFIFNSLQNKPKLGHFWLQVHHVPTKLDRWFQNRSFSKLLIVLFIISIVFHGIYALSGPWIFNSDSSGYYNGASNLINTHQLSGTGIRTPGYPFLIAMTIVLFGDNFIWIVIIQHMLLASLSCIAFWSLRERLGNFAAWIIALFVGIAPIISVSGNTIMTESTFAFFTSLTFFLYVKRPTRKKYLLLTGIFAGLATLVRPNGLIFIAIICVWELFKAWLSTHYKLQVYYLLRSLFIAVGYLTIVSPLILHVYTVDRSVDLSRGLSKVSFWVTAVAEGIVTPELEINRPDRAIWYFPEAWNNNPFEIFYSDFSPIATAWSEWASQYYSEGIAEGIKANPKSYFDIVMASLQYNFSFRWSLNDEYYRPIVGGLGDGHYLYFPYLTYYAYINRYSDLTNPSSATPNNYEPLPVGPMSYRWIPQSPAREFVTGLSYNMITYCWVWISILAFFSVIFIIANKRFQSFIVGWLIWIASILSYAIIGFATDRYIAVFEPIIYCLAGCFIVSILEIILSYNRSSLFNLKSQIPNNEKTLGTD